MNHQDNIRVIFDALQVGLDGAPLEDVSILSVAETIDENRFNRALISIDGETYCISVFRPALVPKPQPLSELFDEEEARR